MPTPTPPDRDASLADPTSSGNDGLSSSCMTGDSLTMPLGQPCPDNLQPTAEVASANAQGVIAASPRAPLAP